MRLSAAILLFSLIACSSAGAISPSTAPTTAPASEVQALVAQLGSDDWRTRQRSQSRLEEMGEQIAPYLRKVAAETADEEVRTRIEAALRNVERSNRWGPTLITLHGKNAPVRDVLADVAGQASIEITMRPDGRGDKADALVTIDADREPFWLVMKQICEQSGLAPQRSSTRFQVVLDRATGDRGKQPCVYRDGMLIMAGSGPALPRGGGPRTFVLRLGVLADPKLPILRATRYMKVDRAIDENGNSLAGPEVSAAIAATTASTSWVEVMAILRIPAQAGTRLATFKGSARFLVHSRSDVWEIPDVLAARNREKQTPIARYRFKGLTEAQDGSYQVQVIIGQISAAVPFVSPVTDHTTLPQSLRLLDSSGRAYRFVGLKGASAGQMQLEYTLSFAPGPQAGPPAKLVWEIPQEIKEVSIPIEFTDLPL